MTERIFNRDTNLHHIKSPSWFHKSQQLSSTTIPFKLVTKGVTTAVYALSLVLKTKPKISISFCL